MATTNIRLVALDVDGTIAGANDEVTDEIVRAIGQLRDAGIRVVLATGRSLAEVLPVWRQLDLPETDSPVIVVGGAMVCEPLGGRTIYQKGIDPELAVRFGRALHRRGRSLMALVDGWRHGFDYYTWLSDDAEDVRRRWFGQMDVRNRWLGDLSEAAGQPRPIRIGAMVAPEEAADLSEQLAEEFDGELEMHAILAPNYGITIVEAFAAGVSKWSAIQYLAGGWRIGRGQIAAVGDDVNDVHMVREAGLGAAIPGRCDALVAAADVVVADGLASFLADLLDGRFG
ncbi:MAG: HAD-IIB family hydrolase [Planctomycetota bacterium]